MKRVHQTESGIRSKWNRLRASLREYSKRIIFGSLEQNRPDRQTAELNKLVKADLRHMHLKELFDECLRQALADDKEPELSNWLWSRLNLPASTKADWLVKLRWGLKINRLIRVWIRVNRDQLDELDAVVETPDWSLLAAAKAERRPVLLAGAHLGPSFLARHYLQVDHPLVMLVKQYPSNLEMRSKLLLAKEESIVELLNVLSDLGTVYIAGDGRCGRSRCPASLLGSPVYLREGAAVLARLSQAQTFWYAARWIGHRIKLDLVPGPIALHHEGRKAWNARWFSFYMAEFQRYLLAGPENVREIERLRFVDEL